MAAKWAFTFLSVHVTLFYYKSDWHGLRNVLFTESYIVECTPSPMKVKEFKPERMKKRANIIKVGMSILAIFGGIGFAQAQTTDKEVEIYERYENGELVEQRQSATENGKPIENFDFEKAKRDMLQKSDAIEKKMEAMQQRMEASRKKMEASMQEKMAKMEQRMTEFEKKSEEMHQKMDQRMKDLDTKRESKKELKEAPVEQPVLGESNENVKFT